MTWHGTIIHASEDIALEFEPEDEAVDADIEEEVEDRVSGSEAEEEEQEEHPVILRTSAVLQRPPVSKSHTGDKERPNDGRHIDGLLEYISHTL